jgi:hypothetical protein
VVLGRGGKPPDKRRVYCGTTCQETAWKRRARFRAAHGLNPDDLRDVEGQWLGDLPPAMQEHVGLRTPVVPTLKHGPPTRPGPGRPPRPTIHLGRALTTAEVEVLRAWAFRLTVARRAKLAYRRASERVREHLLGERDGAN